MDVPELLAVHDVDAEQIVAHAGDDADLADALRRVHLLGDERREQVGLRGVSSFSFKEAHAAHVRLRTPFRP